MLQYSVAARNAGLDARETAAGTAAILKIRTGAPPATCATADAGTVLASATLPSDWMAAASGGAKALSGTWEDASADAAGRASHFRLYDSAGTTCHMQGIACGPWPISTVVAVGDHVTNDSGKVYKCTTGGTTASSGGPTGTGSGISDGTAVWAYVQAAADMALDNGAFLVGQDFKVTAFTITAGNA
jgi:hypothetical protein